MKFDNISVMNFNNALRGMRNPKKSYHLSDSEYGIVPANEYEKIVSDFIAKGKSDKSFDELCFNGFLNKNEHYTDCNDYICYFLIGKNDLDLAKRLISCTSEHRKFLRQIFVSIDVTAPLYVWNEWDTYKIGTTANSTSKMHTLAKEPISIENFETDDLEYSLDLGEGKQFNTLAAFQKEIDELEELRQAFNKTGDKAIWKELIRRLPESFLQTRTWTGNYEILRNMVRQRHSHKLSEWKAFISMVSDLPYADDFIIN